MAKDPAKHQAKLDRIEQLRRLLRPLKDRKQPAPADAASFKGPLDADTVEREARLIEGFAAADMAQQP